VKKKRKIKAIRAFKVI